MLTCRMTPSKPSVPFNAVTCVKIMLAIPFCPHTLKPHHPSSPNTHNIAWTNSCAPPLPPPRLIKELCASPSPGTPSATPYRREINKKTHSVHSMTRTARPQREGIFSNVRFFPPKRVGGGECLMSVLWYFVSTPYCSFVMERDHAAVSGGRGGRHGGCVEEQILFNFPFLQKNKKRGSPSSRNTKKLTFNTRKKKLFYAF